MSTVDSLLGLSLLDYLAWKTGCEYLSDLHRQPVWRIQRALEQVPTHAFSPKCWADALAYLTGSAFSAEHAEKQQVLCALEQLRQNSHTQKQA